MMLAILVCHSPAPANWNDTPTGLDLGKLPHFALPKIRTVGLRERERFRFDGISVEHRDAEVILRGKVKSGTVWSVRMFEGSLVDIYRGDLDRNGTDDYVIVGRTPFGNGRLAPLGQVTILLMDLDGLPSPHEISFYHDFKGLPPQLVDLNRDGRAELIVSEYDESAWDSRVGAFCSGHWTHRLFRIEDLKWTHFEGSTGGLKFPLVHRWTYCCKECPVSETRWPVREDSSPKYVGEIEGKIQQVLESGLDLIRLAPSHGCGTIWPRVAVLDKPGSRQIVFATNRSDFMASLLARIKEAGARVQLRQVFQRQDECWPSVLWATQTK
jgi:hypothetical protein